MNVLWKNRLQLVCFAVFFVFFTAISGVMLFITPAINAAEDYETVLWSLTAAGRFSIAWKSALSGFFLATFPALLVYWANKDLAKDETLSRLNPKRTALVAWAVIAACGVAGAFAFWFRVHPWQNL